MPRKERYPIGRLFAVASIKLERALDIAIDGQSPQLTRRQQRAVLRRLVAALERSRQAAEEIRRALE
jgi:hypothetical protein